MAPVDYITAKLRKDKFRFLLDEMQHKSGMRAKSDNALIGACVFFAYQALMLPLHGDKTLLQVMTEIKKTDLHEFATHFRNHYYDFLECKDTKEFFLKMRKN